MYHWLITIKLMISKRISLSFSVCRGIILRYFYLQLILILRGMFSCLSMKKIYNMLRPTTYIDNLYHLNVGPNVDCISNFAKFCNKCFYENIHYFYTYWKFWLLSNRTSIQLRCRNSMVKSLYISIAKFLNLQIVYMEFVILIDRVS